jgi:alpha-D-ribose 1-methylphosphonate 5-triphosphate synthase subunit PhnH
MFVKKIFLNNVTHNVFLTVCCIITRFWLKVKLYKQNMMNAWGYHT